VNRLGLPVLATYGPACAARALKAERRR